VPMVQTRASGQHVPSTQVVSPVWQQATLVPVPQGVLPAGHAAHVPLTQLPLQQSSPASQEPPIDRHVAHLPFVSQRSPLQQSVSTEQSPPLVAQQFPFTQVWPEVQPTQVPVLGAHVRHWLLSQGQLAPL
jgi:hypothetical protein